MLSLNLNALLLYFLDYKCHVNSNYIDFIDIFVNSYSL